MHVLRRDDLCQCYDSDICDAWRDIIDSVFFVLRAGCQWRQVPHDLVRWRVAYRWFRTLARDGTA